MAEKDQAQQARLSEETVKRLIDIFSNAPKNTATKSVEIAKKPVYTIRNNQIIAGLIGTAGLVIFALGLETLINSLPNLSSPFVMIGIGLFLLAVSGLFLKKLS